MLSLKLSKLQKTGANSLPPAFNTGIKAEISKEKEPAKLRGSLSLYFFQTIFSQRFWDPPGPAITFPRAAARLHLCCHHLCWRVFNKQLKNEQSTRKYGYGPSFLLALGRSRRDRIRINPEARAPSCSPALGSGGNHRDCGPCCHFQEEHGRKSSEAALGSVWGAGGGVTVSLPSMPGWNSDGSGARWGRAGAAGPGAAALALTRSVVIGNWTAEEPGCRFYGNVLEQ